MPKLEFKKISEITSNYDLFLFDLWGVIIEGDQFYPGVIDYVNKVMTTNKTFFVSNAPRPAFKISENLCRWGLNGVTEDMIISAGDISRNKINAMKQDLGGRLPCIYHLGSDRNNDLLSKFEYKVANNLAEADVLLMSLYREDHENLNEFDDLLKEAADLNIPAICANPDYTIPKLGKLTHCAGYFAKRLEEFGGKVFYAGKPEFNIYEEVFLRAPSISKNRILMIGDTYETDIIGGNNAGIHTALVMTGNANKFHRDFDNVEDKIQALYESGAKNRAIPTLVTQLS